MDDKMPKLPEDAEELMGFTDLNPAWMTINRSPDGTVYVTHPLNGTVSVLTPAADSYTSQAVTVGTTPTALTLGPNGTPAGTEPLQPQE